MKKQLSAILAFSIAAAGMAAFPVSADGSVLMNATFESGLEGWSARGETTRVELTTVSAASGLQSALVTGRTDAWNGIAYTLDSATFPAGTTVAVSAKVMQSTELSPVTFKMTVQYSSGGGFGGQNTYDTFATADDAAGLWQEISASSYTIQEGSNPVLYIETDTSKCDFYVDDITITTGGAVVTPPDTPPDNPPSSTTQLGDANASGTIDSADATALMKYLVTKSDSIDKTGADMDKNNTLNAKDLSKLKAYILNPPAVTTTTATTTVTTVTTTKTNPGNNGAVMARVKANMTQNVPSNVQSRDSGKTEEINYYSSKAQRNKHAYVWLPPGYTSSKQYNVMFMGHGVFGNESNMLSGWGVREMASALIESGEADPFIVVFPQMYTDPAKEAPSMMDMNMNTMDRYDDYVYDLTDSLIPYIKEHYSIMEGREHTAIAGFSMGGREALYCGLMHPEIFGYVCASSPAPGIVPASDNFIQNHLGSKKLNSEERMKNGDFKYSDADLPYLLMIGGGTNDTVVGTFPKQYHELFQTNGTDHIWMEKAGAGHDSSVGIPLFYNFFRGVFDTE